MMFFTPNLAGMIHTHFYNMNKNINCISYARISKTVKLQNGQMSPSTPGRCFSSQKAGPLYGATGAGDPKSEGEKQLLLSAIVIFSKKREKIKSWGLGWSDVFYRLLHQPFTPAQGNERIKNTI